LPVLVGSGAGRVLSLALSSLLAVLLRSRIRSILMRLPRVVNLILVEISRAERASDLPMLAGKSPGRAGEMEKEARAERKNEKLSLFRPLIVPLFFLLSYYSNHDLVASVQY